jgi:hypothetical protein
MTLAIEEYDGWSNDHLMAEDERNKINAPLYHYTDAAGLKGIIENEEIWFTSYTHLNDPSEVSFGIAVAIELLNEIGQGSDPRIKMFCDMVIDLFTHENMKSTFGIFIASLSRNGDDLGQWRGYGDNGRGFSLGIAPHLFHVVRDASVHPTSNFVVLPIAYGRAKGRALHMPAIEKAIRIAESIIVREAVAMQDSNVGIPFFDALAKALIASELLLNCMMIKHEAYEHEDEVRLVMIGEHRNLHPHTETRARRGELIPFIRSKFPFKAKSSVTEVVVGPSTLPGAEDGARSLLLPSVDVPVRRSLIPYRS